MPQGFHVINCQSLNVLSSKATGSFSEQLANQLTLASAPSCAGLGNKAITRELNVTEGTVKQHVHNILLRLRGKRPADTRRG